MRVKLKEEWYRREDRRTVRKDVTVPSEGITAIHIDGKYSEILAGYADNSIAQYASLSVHLGSETVGAFGGVSGGILTLLSGLASAIAHSEGSEKLKNIPVNFQRYAGAPQKSLADFLNFPPPRQSSFSTWQSFDR